MEYRQLGNTDLQLPPVALGGNVFGWTLNEKESWNILDAGLDHGFNFIDTANTYSHWVPGNKGGESETIIGKWLKRKGGRDKVMIATKVGGDLGNGQKGLSRDYIMEEVENSLRRLKTDYIDLYQSHFDYMDTPVVETMEAYYRLIKAGKVRYIGASNFTVKRLQESQQTARRLVYPTYQSIQPEYNLYSRESFEKNLEPYIKETGIGVLCYSSLASGFLSGKYRSEEDFGKSVRGAGMKKYFNGRGFRILKALDQVAELHKTTPAAVALAWLISRPVVTAPIASATRINQLQSLFDAAALTLDSESLDLLDLASDYR